MQKEPVLEFQKGFILAKFSAESKEHSGHTVVKKSSFLHPRGVTSIRWNTALLIMAGVIKYQTNKCNAEWSLRITVP